MKRYNPKVYVWFKTKNGREFVLTHMEYRLNDISWRKVSSVMNGMEYGYVEVSQFAQAARPEMFVMGR